MSGLSFWPRTEREPVAENRTLCCLRCRKEEAIPARRLSPSGWVQIYWRELGFGWEQRHHTFCSDACAVLTYCA